MDENMSVCRNWRLCLAALLAAVAGCGAPDAKFVRYGVYAHLAEKAAGYEQGFTEQQKRDVDGLLLSIRV